MITLEPIGFVRSGRSDLADDNWGGVTARIELVESLPAESLDEIEAFSHAEVVYYFDRVPDSEVVCVTKGATSMPLRFSRVCRPCEHLSGST